jgi:hypothetical protein
VGKSAPKAPDYRGAAEAQAESSKEVTNMQTWANRPDQYTPFGNLTWESQAVRDPATGQMVTQWTQNTTLTPESQRALDAQLRLTADRSELGASLMPRAQNEFGQAMSWDDFDQMGGAVDPRYVGTQDIQRSLSTEGLPGIDPTQRYYDQAGDALYNKFSERADPRFAREEEATRARLYAQGLREGDAAFDNAMTDFNQRKDDAYSQAAYDASMLSGQEAQRYFGMDSGARSQLFGERGQQGAFYNQAANQAFNQDLAAGGYNFGQDMQSSAYDTQRRQQQIIEEMQKRGWSLNEINALLTGQQVGMPSMPSFSQATKSDPTNYFGAAQAQGQYNIDQFNAQQSGLNALMGGAAQLGSAAMMFPNAMMFSDRRLKKNIVEWTYDAVRGLQTYLFNYIWESDDTPLRHGYMADEVEKLYPEAVVMVGPFKAVNYGSL